MVEWAREEAKCVENDATEMQSFINLALLNLEDETASTSSVEPNVSVEDYLGCRWSRSSSFD